MSQDKLKPIVSKLVDIRKTFGRHREDPWSTSGRRGGSGNHLNPIVSN